MKPIFVEISSQAKNYKGLIHGGKLGRGTELENLNLSPDSRVEINGQHISFGELSRALIKFDIDRLEKWLNERGQHEIGTYLYRELFGDKKPDEITSETEEADIRIIIDNTTDNRTDNEHVARLPWSLLAHGGVFLATRGWSVAVSTTAEPEKMIDCELPPSPRLLVVAPEIDIEEDKTETKKHLKRLEEILHASDGSYTRQNRFRVVSTWKGFMAILKDYEPDILYWYGHGTGDEGSSKLIFREKHGKTVEKSAGDVCNLLTHTLKHPPLAAYINCCLGDAGGFLGIGFQLESLIPAVVTNRTEARVPAAQAQGEAFLKNVVIKGLSPRKAISWMMNGLAELDLSLGDPRWMTPVLHCRYGKWRSNPPKTLSRIERDPNWRLKLDRVSQFSQVFFETHQMLMEQKPKSLAYLWYGRPDQGLELFHERLKVELREKLSNAAVYEVIPIWPRDMADIDRSFREMLEDAFEVTDFDHIPGRIRTYTKSVSGRKTLVYVRHTPVTSNYTFHTKHIKTYLQWWDSNIQAMLPANAHALSGISYEVKKPVKFHKFLIEKEKLNDLELSDTLFQLLDELDRVNKNDLRNFLKTHNIILPPDIKAKVMDDILERTGGDYESTLDALKELESRAWRLVNQENGGKTGKDGELDEDEDFY